MRQLHYFPSNASMAPHMVLEELGLAFELVLVDRDHEGHKSAAYLGLNPNGTIPVYVEGQLVLYESAAICLHLCDSAPSAGLLAPPGTPERAQCYKWLIWMTNTLQAALMLYFYPERWVDEGNRSGAAEVMRHAEEKIGTLLQQLEAELKRHDGPWLLGQRFSVLDPFCLMLCRWTRGFAHVPPARERAQLGPYLKRVLERPAVQRALATEGLVAPFV
ncbi:MAG: glutathione S-transferase [Burkholderiaceae bacterium]